MLQPKILSAVAFRIDCVIIPLSESSFIHMVMLFGILVEDLPIFKRFLKLRFIQWLEACLDLFYEVAEPLVVLQLVHSLDNGCLPDQRLISVLISAEA